MLNILSNKSKTPCPIKYKSTNPVWNNDSCIKEFGHTGKHCGWLGLGGYYFDDNGTYMYQCIKCHQVAYEMQEFGGCRVCDKCITKGYGQIQNEY